MIQGVTIHRLTEKPGCSAGVVGRTSPTRLVGHPLVERESVNARSPNR